MTKWENVTPKDRERPGLRSDSALSSLGITSCCAKQG